MAGQKTISSTYQEPPPPPPIIPPVTPVSSTRQWLSIPSILTLDITFLQVMATYIPLPSKFSVNIDGVPRSPAAGNVWLTNKKMQFSCTSVASNPATVTISYDGTDPLFKSAAGVAVVPFTDFAVPT